MSQNHTTSNAELLSAFHDPAGTAESITQFGRTRKSLQSVPLLKVKRTLSDEERARRHCFDTEQVRADDDDRTIKTASPHAMKRLREEVYAHNECWESRRITCDDGRRRRLPQALFITLTYPPEFARDEPASKSHLKEFCRRACRAFPGVGGFWVMEYQRSGRVHFHLLMWRGDAMHYIGRRRISATWATIIAPPDAASQHRAKIAATNIKACTGRNQVAEYVAKEVSKHLQKDGSHKPGRFWGKFGRDALDPHRYEEKLLTIGDGTHSNTTITDTANRIHRAGCLQFARRCPRTVQKVLDAMDKFGTAEKIGCMASATGRAAKKCLPSASIR